VDGIVIVVNSVSYSQTSFTPYNRWTTNCIV